MLRLSPRLRRFVSRWYTGQWDPLYVATSPFDPDDHPEVVTALDALAERVPGDPRAEPEDIEDAAELAALLRDFGLVGGEE